jgi:hypothetical protein
VLTTSTIVNKVNKMAEPQTEAGVDHEQQLVNKVKQNG